MYDENNAYKEIREEGFKNFVEKEKMENYKRLVQDYERSLLENDIEEG